MHRVILSVACGLSLLCSVAISGRASAQVVQEQTVAASAIVLNEVLVGPLSKVPHAMLKDAYGVAIIPNVIKGGFIVGARHGRGLLFVREGDGMWHAPVFITLTGGNIGWQAGVQSSDIVLVFKSERSVQNILAGKLTIGADAAAAAGPVGRQGAVATDAQLQAEIYSYSRSRGLFAGVSIDGSVVRVDQLATGAYYRSPAPGMPVIVPAAAEQLTIAVASLAGNSAPGNADLANAAPAAPNLGPNTGPNPNMSNSGAIAQRVGTREADMLRSQLEQLTPQLDALLDPQWRSFLALPPSLFVGNEHPQPEELQAAVLRFQSVATDPRYRELASQPAFQSVFGLLKQYQVALTSASSTLNLPPPPVR
ncbi:Lipid-binding SYLF domain-containing protein [Neorhodopirellula lusitana]|uniref:Lipid-binding SYLF domain-containing protein n=1 Tax=Neorhodopirellula lusitana TaxID=445327 RepID=A0ABY1QMI2_9BACT|nr:lipid-binding SYLF domain-containing protein [Neorhodopirellula lusitana]SMP74168.1 Lipid-binding SYLF domain-containing protein [Neorhodopirellula lusitana]